MSDSVPDPLQDCDITQYSTLVADFCVEQKLMGPEVETREVDLDRRQVAQLEVEAGQMCRCAQRSAGDVVDRYRVARLVQ
ncbi:MAG: hypothetical protein ABR543_16635 [Gemmatimonadaceae bacterium]